MSDYSSRGHAWNKTRQAVLERDGYACVVCGGSANHVDHIIPKSRGGSDDMDNLQAMCAYHNLSKGNREVERGTYWLEEVFPHGLPSPEQK